MKKLLNMTFCAVAIMAMAGCNEDAQFEGELYKKVIYLLSNNDYTFQSVFELGKESTGYVSICCGGTEHINADVTVELEPDDEILAQYNKINYDIEEDKFAKVLDPEKYNIPSFKTVLTADNEDNYALLPITVNPDGLSPDSSYMIPLRIKSTSNYEINTDKQSVLFQVIIKNKYATMESATYYQTTGSEVRETSSGNLASGTSITRCVVPLSKNQVRIFAGTHSYTPSNVTREEIDKYALILTINDDNSINIAPYGSIEVEMLGGATDNYFYIDDKNRYIFALHYRYKDTVRVNDTSEECWISTEEKCIRDRIS